MIEVRQLTKWYGPIQALDHVDLDVPQGKIVGFLGPNGAGKTTALRILTCFMPATSGAAFINGHNVFTQSHLVRQSIGYLPESTPLYPEMRVDEQLHFFGKLHDMPRALRRKRIESLSDMCGLAKIHRRLVGQLSKGNRQRVGLAAALLHDPQVLILDEPTVGLDPTQITSVRQLITNLGDKKTILLSTHILPEVERTCQDVVIIASGRIVAHGSPDQLKAQVRRGARILIELQADPKVVQQAFSPLPSVQQVQATVSGGWCMAALTVKPDAPDIRPLLWQTAMKNNWTVRELRPEVGGLEEFFVQITSGQASAKTSAA